MKKRLVFLSFIIVNSISVSAQDDYWVFVNENAIQKLNTERLAKPSVYSTTLLSFEQYKSFLNQAPKEYSTAIKNGLLISIPYPDNSFRRFIIVETKLMEDGLAVKFPGIKTFVGQGIDDPTAVIRVDYTYQGFHAFVQSAEGTLFIDPYEKNNKNLYISYFSKDHINAAKQNFTCGVASQQRTLVQGATCIGDTLRTYRAAVACTGEYAEAVCAPLPPNAALTHSAIVTTMNRVVGVYEKELAIRMVLVPNNTAIEFTNPNTDPFLGNEAPGVLIDESQRVIDSAIGNANYDIGHTFSTGAGGLAGLGVVCRTGQKALGVTGTNTPYGDNFDIDYVAHEIGHQFGGNHTFNGVTLNCAPPNSNQPFTSYEPGSGTTIQAYAGICATDNLQPNSDPFFHTISFDEITEYVYNGLGRTCPVKTPTGNLPPTVTLPANNKTVPRSTPFMLTGSATDPNGDALTYSWEQFDVGIVPGPWNSGLADPTAPLFRFRIPKTSPTRVFPDFRVIIAGYPVNPPAEMNGLKGETLSPLPRVMTFRLTVRDNRAGGGGVATAGLGCVVADSFKVNVGSDGPFTVTAPNSNVVLVGGDSVNVTWNVAGTNAPAPASNCQIVSIFMSRDGGFTYPDTLLLNTPNDGQQRVKIPNVATNTARMMVKAADNYFFDISDQNFTVTFSPLPVVLLNFKAVAGTQNIRLDWSTSSEVNSKNYVVERSVNPNSGFTTIGSVEAAGNSSSVRQYRFIDVNVQKGKEYYYRLRQVDVNNRHILSHIERAMIEATANVGIVALPNPVRDVVQIAIADLQPAKFTMSLIDVLGQVVMSKQFSNSNSNVVTLDLSKQPAGVYSIRFEQNGVVRTAKIIKD
jgi:hypothetical protein